MRRGLRVAVAETFQYSIGRFDGGGFEDQDGGSLKTRGLGLRTKGLFKLLAFVSDSEALALLRDHVDLRYDQSTYFADDERETGFRSLSLLFTEL